MRPQRVRRGAWQAGSHDACPGCARLATDFPDAAEMPDSGPLNAEARSLAHSEAAANMAETLDEKLAERLPKYDDQLHRWRSVGEKTPYHHRPASIQIVDLSEEASLSVARSYAEQVLATLKRDDQDAALDALTQAAEDKDAGRKVRQADLEGVAHPIDALQPEDLIGMTMTSAGGYRRARWTAASPDAVLANLLRRVRAPQRELASAVRDEIAADRAAVVADHRSAEREILMQLAANAAQISERAATRR
jgi:hypothetical protein